MKAVGDLGARAREGLGRLALQGRVAAAWDRAPARLRRAVVAGAILLLLFIPPFLSPYTQSVLFFPVGVFVLLALGLNVVVGLAGLLDLGYVAFYAVGAYTSALLSTKAGWNTWETIPVAIGAAMLSGVLLGAPTLRLRGDYLAIVTLGFGEIIRIIATNDVCDKAADFGWQACESFTNGPRGITSIPHPPPGPPGVDLGPLHVEFLLDPLPYYYLVLAACVLAVLLVRRLTDSRVGRAWIAIREDEDAAEAMGVPTFTMKLWAFAIGASTGGLAGALYASKVGFINPGGFTFLVSILVLASVVLGGMGSNAGVIVGAFAVAFLPEYFRDFQRYRVLAFGAALVLLMIVRPQGLIPSRRRAAELAEAQPGEALGAAAASEAEL